MTHIREKLRFYEKRNKTAKIELNDLETEILSLRNVVSLCKKDRDNVRHDNKELKIKQGFASNELLISDFEKRKRTILFTTDRVNDLQARHHALSLQINNMNNANNNNGYHKNSSSTLSARGLSKILFIFFYFVLFYSYFYFILLYFILFFLSTSMFYLFFICQKLSDYRDNIIHH